MQERRLAAIMFTDIVGYTTLMSKNERKAFEFLKKNRRIQWRLIKKYRGRWLKEMGDGILASFSSNIDAIMCAASIQKAVEELDIPLRIGIHQGDVIFENKDVLGDGVNIASRIQGVSDTNGIVISEKVYSDVKNKEGLDTEYLGEKPLKGVEFPVGVYKVICKDTDVLDYKIDTGELTRPLGISRISIVMGILIIAMLALALYYFIPKMANPTLELNKSIAVLPLDYLSEDQNKQYLADGVMDAIIGHLSKIEGLRVTPKTSVEQYRETTKPASVIGEELRVSYLIQGSFLMIKNQVRLTIQLVIAEEEDHVLYKEYDKDWSEIFDVQSEVAQAITKEVEVIITPEVKERIETIPTESLEAYNLYLQGRYFWNQAGKDNYDKSIEYYKRALEIDPNFALAYAGMATTYTSYAWGGYLPWGNVTPQLKKAAMRALEIDNTLGEAYAELANVRLVYDWKWSESEKEFKRALELNPSSARTHNRYAWLLSVVGRHDEAIKQNRLAHELDPLSVEIWVELGRRYYFARDYDRAIEEYQKVLDFYSNIKHFLISWYVYSEFALALSLKGLHNEAIEEYLKADFEPTDYWRLGYIYGVAGEREKALEILNYYFELSKKEFIWPTNIAFIYIGLGEKDKAIEWLEKSYEQRGSWMIQLKVDPMFDSLRSDPRFQDLLERMNFPD